MIDASTFHHVTATHRLLASLSLTRTPPRLKYESYDESSQILQTRKKTTTIQKSRHPSEVEQAMLIGMNFTTPRKPVSSMQVIALSCFTPRGFEMEKEPSRSNAIQSQRKQNALRMPRIRFKDKSGRSRWFLGRSCQVKYPPKHGLRRR